MSNKTTSYKVIGIPDGMPAPSVGGSTNVSIVLPELSELMRQLDKLILKETNINFPAQKEPVINIQIPEFPSPIVNFEAPSGAPVNVEVNPNLRIEMTLAKSWQIYSLLIGVYLMIFLCAWHMLPSVMG